MSSVTFSYELWNDSGRHFWGNLCWNKSCAVVVLSFSHLSAVRLLCHFQVHILWAYSFLKCIVFFRPMCLHWSLVPAVLVTFFILGLYYLAPRQPVLTDVAMGGYVHLIILAVQWNSGGINSVLSLERFNLDSAISYLKFKVNDRTCTRCYIQNI